MAAHKQCTSGLRPRLSISWSICRASGQRAGVAPALCNDRAPHAVMAVAKVWAFGGTCGSCGERRMRANESKAVYEQDRDQGPLRRITCLQSCRKHNKRRLQQPHEYSPLSFPFRPSAPARLPHPRTSQAPTPPQCTRARSSASP
jgi:hypothetical protein